MYSRFLMHFALNTSLDARLFRHSFRFLVLALSVFVLSPITRAVNPPPDGGYPNANTAEGDNALLNLTTGTQNTAVGFSALGSNTTGSRNTATGFVALVLNNFRSEEHTSEIQSRFDLVCR